VTEEERIVLDLTSSVILALMSIFPLDDSTQTKSPSLMNFSSAFLGLINNKPSVES